MVLFTDGYHWRAGNEHTGAVADSQSLAGLTEHSVLPGFPVQGKQGMAEGPTRLTEALCLVRFRYSETMGTVLYSGLDMS